MTGMVTETAYEVLSRAGLGSETGDVVKLLPMVVESVSGAAGDIAWIAANGTADRMEVRALAQYISRWTRPEYAEEMRRLEVRADEEPVTVADVVAALHAAAESRAAALRLEAEKLRAAGMAPEDAGACVVLLASVTKDVPFAATALARVAAAGAATRQDLAELAGAIGQRAAAHVWPIRILNDGAPLSLVLEHLSMAVMSVYAALGVQT